MLETLVALGGRPNVGAYNRFRGGTDGVLRRAMVLETARGGQKGPTLSQVFDCWHGGIGSTVVERTTSRPNGRMKTKYCYAHPVSKFFPVPARS